MLEENQLLINEEETIHFSEEKIRLYNYNDILYIYL